MFHHRIRGDQQHFVRRDELKVDICIYSIECDIYNYEHCLLIYIVASYVWNIILQMDMMIDYYTLLMLMMCMVQVAWEIFTPLLHRIDNGEFKSIAYKAGSRGPGEADDLLKRVGYVQTHGYIWIPPTL